MCSLVAQIHYINARAGVPQNSVWVQSCFSLNLNGLLRTINKVSIQIQMIHLFTIYSNLPDMFLKWEQTFNRLNAIFFLSNKPHTILWFFLRIYITNHLNHTLNYTARVANCCKHWFYLISYIEMFRINPLKSEDFCS